MESEQRKPGNAELAKLLLDWADELVNGPNEANGTRIPEVDLLELRARDFNYDWLIEKWWPESTQLHVFAQPKTGKSLLSLWIAANLAIGRDPFTWESTKRQQVLYLDYEMTDKDLADRLDDMGFDFGELSGWLHYCLYPQIAPMDTAAGGRALIENAKAYDSNVVIIDTLARVVKGEENSNDTYRNFYNHTGQYLRSEGIALLRLDHAGHQPGKSRGASSKADDVDLVYSLERRDSSDGKPGYRLTRTHARVGNVSETVELVLNDDPLSIKSTQMRSWNSVALGIARELDRLGAPVSITKNAAISLLKESGYANRRGTVVLEAIRYRKSTDDLRQFNL